MAARESAKRPKSSGVGDEGVVAMVVSPLSTLQKNTLSRRPQDQGGAAEEGGAAATATAAGEAEGAAAGTPGDEAGGEGGEAGASSSCPPPDAMYDLACVLYHKGTNVHSGHYIAEV